MMTITMPSGEELIQKPFYSLVVILLSILSVCSVPLFVFISGWFSIRPTIKGICSLIFQYIFVIAVCIGISSQFSFTSYTLKSVLSELFYTKYNFWFFFAYLGLYVFSPVLNHFAEHVTQTQFRNFLIAFYIFQCYFSWLFESVNYFYSYGIVFLLGLYLTMRYFRLYPAPFIERHSGKLFLAILLGISCIVFVSQYYWGMAARMARLDNPFVIIACVALLYKFNTIKFQSRLVNVLATSCLSVYLIHDYTPIFLQFQSVIWKITKDQDFESLILLFLFLFLVFCVCFVIDIIRQFIQNKIFTLLRF